jgi:S-DNA-T family DNA segregation ATPase FtsK/SpoIIIE
MNKRYKSKLTEERKNKNGNTGRKKTKEEFSIPVDIKKQFAGFLLILFGILLLSAIISYSDKDQANLNRIDIRSIFRSETYTNNPMQNWLGLAGAFISNFLINDVLGYFTVIVSLIVISFGWMIFRRKPMYRFVTISIYSVLLMISLAASSGVLRIFIGKNNFPSRFSGVVGDFLGSIVYQLLGSVGASLFFLLCLSAIVVLIIDGNILKSLARLKLLYEKIKENFRSEKKKLVTKAEDKKKEKAEETEKQINPEDAKILEAIKKERERIQKLKSGKDEETEVLIKETEINRPKTDAPVEKITAPKEKKEKKGVDLDKLLVKEEKKEDISEIDINPENSNDTDEMKNLQEDDFIEEKLEDYILPTLDLLDEPTKEEFEVIPDDELSRNGRLLQEKLLKFGIEIEKVFATPGPVVTLYELIPAPEVKLSKIESLQDDIALAMKAKGIRMIIPIPGKGTVGVEIPNSKAQIVRIKSILSSQKFTETHKRMTVAFGKMIDGEIFIDDLSKMPHVLIAGATGSGKSVGINTLIASLLYKLHPSDLKFVLIDPKKIELSLYKKLRNHFIATSTDINESIVTSPSNAVSILKSVELEMEQRYDKLANAGVRNIDAYNQKYKDGLLKNNEVIRHKKMPYIVVIIDELADLMITAKRDIEDPITRVAQMARAVGIHLIVATQRPSVDVITGVIKANFPVRIAYQVASKIDSRTILDMGGADALLRNGDMLYMSSNSPKPIRIQNAYISTEECERLVDFISNQKGYSKPYLLPSLVEKRYNGNGGGERDEMFEDAARLIMKLQQCSTSTLQRRLKLGYARAARIVDQMEAAGIVGPNQGAKGREILISEEDLEMILSD